MPEQTKLAGRVKYRPAAEGCSFNVPENGQTNIITGDPALLLTTRRRRAPPE
jgi:hypothetical protein